MPKITLPPYVTIEHPTELKGKVLILQTSPPYMIGQVWKFDSMAKMLEFMDRNDSLGCYIQGYRLFITEYGSLEDYEMSDVLKGDHLAAMADFYLEARIKNFPQGFTRYKI